MIVPYPEVNSRECWVRYLAELSEELGAPDFVVLPAEVYCELATEFVDQREPIVISDIPFYREGTIQ